MDRGRDIGVHRLPCFFALPPQNLAQLSIHPLGTAELLVRDERTFVLCVRSGCAHHLEQLLGHAVDIDGQRHAAVHHDGEANLLANLHLRGFGFHGNTSSRYYSPDPAWWASLKVCATRRPRSQMALQRKLSRPSVWV